MEFNQRGVLRETDSEARIVFLTVEKDPEVSRVALETGALGYVLKPRLGADLIPAIKLARLGRHYVSPGCEREVAGQSDSLPESAAIQSEGQSRILVRTLNGVFRLKRHTDTNGCSAHRLRFKAYRSINQPNSLLHTRQAYTATSLCSLDVEPSA